MRTNINVNGDICNKNQVTGLTKGFSQGSGTRIVQPQLQVAGWFNQKDLLRYQINLLKGKPGDFFDEEISATWHLGMILKYVATKTQNVICLLYM